MKASGFTPRVRSTAKFPERIAPTGKSPLGHLDSALATRTKTRTLGTFMSLKFEKNSEAFLSVLTLVVGADQVGSLAERDFLFQKVKGISIFENPSPADFSKLLGRVTDAVYSKLPQKDGVIT